MLGLCEEYLKCVHVFVDVANFAPFAACFGEKSGVRDKRVADAKNLGKRDGLCQVSKSVGVTLENTGRMDCESLCDTIQSTIR